MKKDGLLNWINISDLHFGDGDPVKLYEELEYEFFVPIKRMAKDLDLISLSGDLFHRKLSMNEIAGKLVLKFVDKLLEICYENDIKLRFVKGTQTHDFNQLDNFKHHEVNFDFRIINTVEYEEIFPDVYVLYLPEEYMEDSEEYYSEFLPLPDGAKYDIIIGHGTFDFAAFENQAQESERPIKNAPVFKYKDFEEYVYGPVVFGHIHGRNAYKNKIYYGGSFTRTCHGEPKPKGFLHVQYDTNELTHTAQFIENKLAPEFNTYRISDIVSESSTVEEKLEAIRELMAKDSNVKIKLDSTVDSSELAVLKEAFSSQATVRIDVSERLEKEKQEAEDDTYGFIVRREYDVPTTIQKFIKLEKGIDLDLEKITELIGEEDLDD